MLYCLVIAWEVFFMAENTNGTIDRSKVIVKTGILGIVVNVLMASIKAFLGLLSNSVAIVLDAVNNN